MRKEIDNWSNLTQKNVTDPMYRMSRWFDRFPEGFFSKPSPQVPSMFESEWRNQSEYIPPCDIEEKDGHYLISMDLPGLSKQDIRVEIQGNQLRVSGTRSQERTKDRGTVFTQERSSGSFLRCFTLAEPIPVSKVEADYKDGVLHIALPLDEASRSQTVRLGEGKAGLLARLLHRGEPSASNKPKEVRVA